MNEAGVEVIVTAEEDPLTAAVAVIEGRPLPPPPPHEHGHTHRPVMP
jgi:DMSO/TMAO reductase YedYZ molybdopterin-dependent catalytic subunit